MLDREIYCKQLTTKRTVSLLSWGELAAEKRERLPGAIDLLWSAPPTPVSEASVDRQTPAVRCGWLSREASISEREVLMLAKPCSVSGVHVRGVDFGRVG